MKAIFEEIASEDPELLRQAVVKGLKAAAPKSFQYLQLVTAYIDGKPTEAMPVDEVVRIMRAIGTLFIGLVEDVELRRRFSHGVRQLVGVTEMPSIDAHAGDQA